MAKKFTKKIIISIAVAILLVTVISFFSVIIISKFFKKEKTYYKVNFKQVSFWQKDDNSLAFIPSFKASCKVFNKKKQDIIITKEPTLTTVKDWQNVCNNFSKAKFNKSSQVYEFIEKNFNIYLVKGEKKAHVTGYYRIELEGSLVKEGDFKYPIYKLPKNLITVNLGDFNPSLSGTTIYGRIDKNKLMPYYSREEISNGALVNKNLEILWLNNKYSAFLLHVQGSGLIKLKKGNKKIYLSYNGRNGYPFNGIYNYLKSKDYLKNSNKLNSMEAVYDFFDKNPDKIDEVLNQNQSYIFFKETNKNAWHAAFDTNPQEERTIAVDPNFEPLGAPLLLAIKDPLTGNSMVRLVVANDTGSAIKGAARVDFYWGLGKEAGFKAVATNQKGSLYLFLPKVFTKS